MVSPRCPIWSRGVLERLRRHVSCGRVFVYGPGLLNTPLDWGRDSVFSRVFYSWNDGVVLYYREFEGEIVDDLLYLIESGPRYFHYDLSEYGRGRLISSCAPESLDSLDQRSLLYNGLLRLYTRERQGKLEVCGSNPSIIPLTDKKYLVVGFAFPRIEGIDLNSTMPTPSYLSETIVPNLYKVRALFTIVRIEDGSLSVEEAEFDAYHTDPEYIASQEKPAPHIVFHEWDKSSGDSRLILSPLYTHHEEYAYSLLAGALLLLGAAHESESGSEWVFKADLKVLRKLYKKIAKHAERATGVRPEGGVLGLADYFSPWLASRDGEELVMHGPCSECERRLRIEYSLLGPRISVEALASGAGLVF